MKWFTALGFLLLMSTWYQVCTANPFVAGKLVYDKAMSIYGAVQEVEAKPEELTLKDTDAKLRELSNDFQDLGRDILNKISTDLKDKLSEIIDEFFGLVRDVEHKYGRFVNYLKNPNRYERSTIRKFATESTSSSPHELDAILGKLHEVFVGRDFRTDTLLSMIAKKSTAEDLICVKQESKQQLINDLFQAYVDSSTKGMLVLLYSYDTLAKLEKKTYRAEQDEVKEAFKNRIDQSKDHFKNSMKTASREIWRCDPETQKKGVTYDKLQQVFQGFFVHELDTYNNGKKIDDVFPFMWNTCSDMKDAILNCHTDHCTAQPGHKRCYGHIRDCQKMPRWFQVCHSSPESDRSYDWMREDMEKGAADYGRFYSNCQDTQGFDSRIPLQDACLCTCESEKTSIDRYFSLQNVVSDVGKNKVVTGVQLIKDYYVFHIKIEQGTLGPDGVIIGQPEWKNVSRISESQRLNKSVSEIRRVPVYEDRTRPMTEFKKNNLLYAVTWKQNKVYLDTLDAGKNRVVTGVRFQHVDTNSLRLEIQTTPFDYATGKLDESASQWVFNKKNYYKRKEAALTEPDDPLQATAPNKVVASDNQYVDFRPTDWRKDLGQYTVPFIDTQKVTPTPRMPLTGVGLVLRGQKYSGGFLALKVAHYDFSEYL